jgi:hypothetical protein
MEVNASSGTDPRELPTNGAASHTSDQRILLRGDFLLAPEGSPLRLVKFFLKGHAAGGRAEKGGLISRPTKTPSRRIESEKARANR